MPCQLPANQKGPGLLQVKSCNSLCCTNTDVLLGFCLVPLSEYCKGSHSIPRSIGMTSVYLSELLWTKQASELPNQIVLETFPSSEANRPCSPASQAQVSRLQRFGVEAESLSGNLVSPVKIQAGGATLVDLIDQKSRGKI